MVCFISSTTYAFCGVRQVLAIQYYSCFFIICASPILNVPVSHCHAANTYFGSLDGSKAMMTILVDICGWKDLQHGWTYWLVTQTSHCCRFLSTILWVLTLFSDNALIHALLCLYITFAYLILYWFIKVWAWSPACKY